VLAEVGRACGVPKLASWLQIRDFLGCAPSFGTPQAAQAVVTDEEAVSTARAKVTTDSGSVEAARVTLAGGNMSLDAAASSAVFYETGAAYTTLPSPGDVIRRGQALFAIGGQPVLLLYGGVTAWRAFRPGMSPGRDVAALNANLRALGYGPGLAGDSFTA